MEAWTRKAAKRDYNPSLGLHLRQPLLRTLLDGFCCSRRPHFCWVVFIYAGILDTLDGKIARFTRTGTRFGAELDSLVDAISFGVAPSFIMFELFFADAQWSWTLSFVFVTATVVRLARFNLEEGGELKKYFHGLPAPAAGMTLAAYYPFSQTPIFAEYLSAYPWEQIAPVGTVILSILMVSSVPYDKLPKIGFSTPRGILNSIFVSTCLLAAVFQPRYYFFTALLLYIIWGLLRSILSGRMRESPEVTYFLMKMKMK
ncbi:MAG: CDP-diacylglycerol--serine O-phosphatidyltransferase [Gammaproteobacteria bacterium]|nr:MAG: CDP-diacylglycerol--serine O-phosphatidyltransferase [Gammaproteobacteria bacterium]